MTVTDRLHVAAVQRLARRLAQRLDGRGWVPRNDLRKACASSDRPTFDAAIDAAIAAGQIEAREVTYRGQAGTQYRTTAL